MKKPFVGMRRGAAFLGILVLWQSGPASAQSDPSDSRITERLQCIRLMLEQGKPGSDRWWYGWLIGYGAATVGQGAVGLAGKDKRTRQDMFLGAATTCLGAIGQVISPMTPSGAPGRLANLPEGTPGERMKKCVYAEELLEACARREQEGRSWKTHAVAGAVNLGGALVVCLGFKRDLREGVWNFAFNTAVAEAQIWTQPMRAVDDYGEIARRGRTKGHPSRPELKRSWCLYRTPGGIGICIEL
jgi:hypothetical protein